MDVHLSNIPYENKFGSSQGAEMNLGKYIEEVMDGEVGEEYGGRYPWYVFKGNRIPDETKNEESIVHTSRFYIPDLILDAVSMFFPSPHPSAPSAPRPKLPSNLVNAQWALGKPGTGAPVHFHNGAWNMLFYGRKKWFIFPPFYSIMSKSQVFENESSEKFLSLFSINLNPHIKNRY